MKDLRFTLTPADLEVIGDSLQKNGTQELLLVFSLLESQGKDIVISTSTEKPPEVVHEMGELIRDLGLEPVPPKQPVIQEHVPQQPPPKVIATHGWDDRLPKPAIDPDMVEQKPQPQPVRTPQPVPEPVQVQAPTPPQRVRRVEPHPDRDVMCVDCGGFAPTNPHSDPKMNCDCVHKPVLQPQPTTQPAPSAGWSTNPQPTPKPQGDVWSTT